MKKKILNNFQFRNYLNIIKSKCLWKFLYGMNCNHLCVPIRFISDFRFKIHIV